MSVLIGIAVVLLVSASCLALWRMIAGPTALDRIISSDVLVAVVIAAIGLYTVAARNATGLPILLALCLVGFTGAVGVARLVVSSTAVRRRFHRRQALKGDADDD